MDRRLIQIQKHGDGSRIPLNEAFSVFSYSSEDSHSPKFRKTSSYLMLVSNHLSRDLNSMSITCIFRYDSSKFTVNCGVNAFNQIESEIIGTKGRIEIPDTFSGA
jgi:hypothetical protein